MSGDFEFKVIKESDEQKKSVDLVLGSGVKDTNVNIRISSETKKSLEELAKKYKMSVSEVVRQLTEQGLELVNRQK